MPQCTAWIDDAREHLDIGRIPYASENGIVKGKPGPRGVVATSFAAPVEATDPRHKPKPITRYVGQEALFA